MKTYYYALDGLRFAAALSVCLFHLGFYDWAATGSTSERMLAGSGAFPALTPFVWMGWIGVGVFFVISGFVIANSANGASPFTFLRGRALRLLPAAWICATITLVAWRIIAHDPVNGAFDSYARSLMLWLTGPWIDGVYWSLAVEIVFYAIVFLLLLRGGFGQLHRFAWTLVVLGGLYAIAQAATNSAHSAPSGLWKVVTEHDDLLMLKYGAFFALGIWLWMMTRRLMPRSGWVGVSIALTLIALQLWGRAQEIRLYEAPAALGQSPFVPVFATLLALALLFAFVRFPSTFAPVSPQLRAGLKWLGKATYPLYLVNNVVGVGIARVLLEHGAPPYAALAAASLLAVVIAMLVARLAEPAVRRALGWALGLLEERIRPVRGLGFLLRPTDALDVRRAP